MSLITDDPDHSPRDCSTKRHRHHHHHACQSRGRRRALIAASSALASLLSLAIILWLTLRPSTPRFSLLAAAATATDLALPNATVVVDAAFTAHNPNARAAALYDRLQARASYAGLQLTATAPLPPFDQPQGDVVLSASLSSSPVAAAVTAGGRGLLRLRIEGQLRWKVAAWVSGRHALSVDCVAVVLLQPSPSPSQLRAVVLQGSQWVPEMSARLLVALQRLRLRPYIYMRTREGRKDMHRSTCTVHLIDRIRNGIGMSRVEALSLSGMSAIPAEYVRPEEERRDLGDAFDLAWTPGAPLIPVVDIAAFDTSESDSEASRACVEAVRAAATEWGVMHIAGHGIPPELMDQLRTAGTDFFALPIQEKEAYANDPAAGRLQGYGSRLATNASGQREWEDYLFHLIHPDHRADHALWPASPPEYIPVTRRFGHLVRSLASKLLALLSLGLGLPHPTLEQRLVGEEDLLLKLKINYYPRCPQPDLAVGVEAHTDVSALSFILHNGVPGLQVHHAGRWVTARSEPGTIVVHVGDALEILSNGRYTSVLHRGLVTRKAVRVSWVVFCEPPPDAVLLQPLPEVLAEAEPARFTPRTFKQHLERKVLKKDKDEEEARRRINN